MGVPAGLAPPHDLGLPKVRSPQVLVSPSNDQDLKSLSELNEHASLAYTRPLFYSVTNKTSSQRSERVAGAVAECQQTEPLL